MLISVLAIYACLFILLLIVVKLCRYFDFDIINDVDLKDKSDVYCAFSMSNKAFLFLGIACLFILSIILGAKINDADDYTDTENINSTSYDPAHEKIKSYYHKD